ncbi:LEA1 U2 small nuclear ribonucleoprotein A' [Candida maltosa Xu316]
MRLTVKSINEAPVILNPEGKLTILLRDLDLTECENLSITENKFQVIDLSNNGLLKLGNIPPNFTNLECLLLSNNNISYIDEDTFSSNNNIKSLMLYNNNIKSFQPIMKDKFTNLETLVLLGNPITELDNYRIFTIWLIPSLKVLDFQKIKNLERIEGEKLFGKNHDEFNQLALEMLSKSSNNGQLNGNNKQVDNVVKKLSDNEKEELLKKLETATSLEEIEKIEEALKNGVV